MTSPRAAVYAPTVRPRSAALCVLLLGCQTAAVDSSVPDAAAAPRPSDVFIDFQNLTVAEGDPVPVIEGVAFEAEVAIQGGEQRFAFRSPAGQDTGLAPPFNTPGNVFITGRGGIDSPERFATIRVRFPYPVANLSFLVCDLDAVSTRRVDQLTATALGEEGRLRARITLMAPQTGTVGDGEVARVDFGSTSNIHELVIRVENSGHLTSTLGFGVDDIRFDLAPDSRDLRA